MKFETVEYFEKCMECQLVKVEHRHPAGLLQPLPILEWKWELISLDFIIGLPKSKRKNDAIMVVVEKLTKEDHFIPVKFTFKADNIANILMRDIYRLHGVKKTVISDSGAKCTSNFRKTLFKGLETNLNFSISYHPQTNG